MSRESPKVPVIVVPAPKPESYYFTRESVLQDALRKAAEYSNVHRSTMRCYRCHADNIVNHPIIITERDSQLFFQVLDALTAACQRVGVVIDMARLIDIELQTKRREQEKKP